MTTNMLPVEESVGVKAPKEVKVKELFLFLKGDVAVCGSVFSGFTLTILTSLLVVVCVAWFPLLSCKQLMEMEKQMTGVVVLKGCRDESVCLHQLLQNLETVPASGE